MKRPVTESERRKLSEERKRPAAQRTGSSGAPAPGLTMRISPGALYPSSGDQGPLGPLLVPDITLKSTAGRYQPRKIVSRLRQSLAVHTLVAFHCLLPLLGTRQAAEDKLATVAASGIERLLREGRRHLSRETAFGSEPALQRFSEIKQKTLKAADIDIPWRKGELVEAELSAVRLVSIALVRAQAILAAFDDAQRAAKTLETKNGESETTIDDASWAAIKNAFERYHPDLGIHALWEIAVYADINPMVLWPQHILGFADLFEIARFIGRIDRGIEAGLAPVHLDRLSAIVQEADGDLDEIEARIGLFTRDQDKHELARRLQALGFEAFPVMTAFDLVALVEGAEGRQRRVDAGPQRLGRKHLVQRPGLGGPGQRGQPGGCRKREEGAPARAR